VTYQFESEDGEMIERDFSPSEVDSNQTIAVGGKLYKKIISMSIPVVAFRDKAVNSIKVGEDDAILRQEFERVDPKTGYSDKQLIQACLAHASDIDTG